MGYEKLPDILTLKQVAEFLQVSNLTIQRAIHAGKLKAFKPGRDYRILKEDLILFIEGEKNE
ncbi:helix-turn-helix domain-containing protein [Ruminiclostridium josui]|uniref:helix-turn-helix domain-containing protein n=1 Tax=Ruminiclostridium josui TaxID=1499 RepID=UPI000464E858|nr:helix-turn-helix domain-containing protein [Ruminiclostridium josui]